MRDLRIDEIAAGYKSALDEQDKIINHYQQQRKDLRIEWAKLCAYMNECPMMAASPEIKEKLAATIANIDNLEKKLTYHQNLSAALARKASSIEGHWTRAQEPLRVVGARPR